MTEVVRNPIVDSVIGAAIQVHRTLGPGLLESAYQACLAHELLARGIPFRREVPVPLTYGQTRLDCGYRLDFLVQDTVIVEVKSVERLLPIHSAQAMTYLRLTGADHLLMLNFNALTLKAGLKSFVGPRTPVPRAADQG